jgi:hypothetical protein
MLEIRLLASSTAPFGRGNALLGERSEYVEKRTKLRARRVDHCELFASPLDGGDAKVSSASQTRIRATNVGSFSEKKLKTRKMVASPAIRTMSVPRQL